MATLIKILLPIVCALVVVIGIALSINYLITQDGFLGAEQGDAPTPAFIEQEYCKGFIITTGINSDFPPAQGLSTAEQQAAIDEILNDAVSFGYTTVFFEATDGMSAFYSSNILPSSAAYLENEGDFSFFDPLAYLCEQAYEHELEVYALVNPYDGGFSGTTMHEDNPVNSLEQSIVKVENKIYLSPSSEEVLSLSAEIFTELSAYPLSGVVVDGLDRLPSELTSSGELSGWVEKLLSSIGTAMGDSRSIGLVVNGAPSADGFTISPEQTTQFVSDGSLDLVIPSFSLIAQEGASTYEELLGMWSDTLSESDARLLSLTAIEDFSQYSATVDYNMLITSLNSTLSGAVFDDYSRIKSHPDQSERMMSFLAKTTLPPSHDLAISTTLAVGNPADSSVTLDNSYTQYYITGTSDPTQELYMNGNLLTRYTVNGGWGVQVSLSVGQNTFTFSQGDNSRSVTLVRSAAPTTGSITNITQNSIFPTRALAYNAGDSITLSCTAPSGGSVTVGINGQTLQMTQVAATQTNGVPATFTATYTIPADASPGEVSSIGRVNYTLNYAGATTHYTSAGEILVAGSGVPIIAKVTYQMAGVYNSPTTLSGFITSLVTDTTLRLSGEYDGSRAVTPDGGFVPLDSIAILTGQNDPAITYDGMSLVTGDGFEEFVLEGDGLNRYSVEHTDTALIVTLEDSYFSQTDFSELGSEIFSSIFVENFSDGSARLTLTPATVGGVWGWDFTINDEGKGVLFCSSTPTLSSTYARPLEGIHVMVDPGHGGTDPGAIGSAGEGGPHEHTLNMAVSDVLRYRLEQLGASVTMTRADDESFINLVGRVDLAAALRPDIFISIHHNSTALTTDATKIDYATTFYCFGISEKFADATLSTLQEATGRDIKAAEHAAYYVTRISYAPSVLFETGFLSNPAQQEECADLPTIYKTANALADAVVMAFE